MAYQEIKNVILEVNESVLTESMIQVRSKVVLLDWLFTLQCTSLITSLGRG